MTWSEEVVTDVLTADTVIVGDGTGNKATRNNVTDAQVTAGWRPGLRRYGGGAPAVNMHVIVYDGFRGYAVAWEGDLAAGSTTIPFAAPLGHWAAVVHAAATYDPDAPVDQLAPSYLGAGEWIVRVADAHMVDLPATSDTDPIESVGFGASVIALPYRIAFDSDGTDNQDFGNRVAVNWLAAHYIGDPDSARPRYLVGSFVHGYDSAAIVTTTVEAYPEIVYWFTPNEPDSDNFMEPETWAAYVTAFRAAVLAATLPPGAPPRKILGPDANTVGVNATFINQAAGPNSTTVGGWVRRAENAGGLDACDEISGHGYHVDGHGSLRIGRLVWQSWLDYLAATGHGSKPLWGTENGSHVADNTGTATPADQAHAILLTFILAAQYGIPKERLYYFYYLGIGYWENPCSIVSFAGQKYLAGALLYEFSRQLYGCSPDTHVRLDFGSVGERYLIGSVERAPGTLGAGVLYCMSDGVASTTVPFVLGGTVPATVDYYDGVGNLTTLAVTGGVVHMPVTQFPSYLRIPAGCTVAVGDLGWGTDHSAAATAHMQGGDAGTQGPAVVLTDGDLSANLWGKEDGGGLLLYGGVDYGGDTLNPYRSRQLPTTAAPLDFSVRLGAPKRVGRVLVECPKPFRNVSTILDADVLVRRADGSVVTVATIGQDWPVYAHPTSELNGHRAVLVFPVCPVWAWDVAVSPAVPDAVEVVLRVREVSFGDTRDEETYHFNRIGLAATDSTLTTLPFGGDGFRTLSLRAVRVTDPGTGADMPPAARFLVQAP